MKIRRYPHPSCGLVIAAVIGVLCQVGLCTEYFVSNKTTSGAGTLANPYGMPDLPNPNIVNDNGAALSALQPGDTLTFLGGNYTLNTQSSRNYLGYLHPVRSGTASQPITIRAKPGDTVTLILASGTQPALGTAFPPGVTGVDYARFQGFYIVDNEIDNNGTGEYYAVQIGGTGHEVSYCKITGHNVASGDNWDGIRVQGGTNCWIHHNEITGFTGPGHNSNGIEIYTNNTGLFEDNYIHGNSCGIFDKDSANGDIHRRNFLTSNGTEFLGSNQSTLGRSNAQYYLYDNVIDGTIDLLVLSNSVEIHDNLIRNIPTSGDPANLCARSSGSVYQTKMWNNVYLAQGSPVMGIEEDNTPWTTTPPNNPFTYCDYNIYTSTPSYRFGRYSSPDTTYNFTQMQGFGFETHSWPATSASSVYVDQVSYVLKTSPTNWTTAGRYGDPVGPDNVAQILDVTRYGPTAITIMPMATDDSYSLYADQTLTVAASTGVLANDTGGGLTAVKVTDPSHGSVTLNSDGSFTYTPTAGYTGNDSFTYQAHNATGDSNTATVSITINYEPSITLISPNGGEVWSIGSTASVAWTTLGTVGNVDIDLSTNGGTSWTTLVANTANTGSRVVTVPNIYSTFCLVRVKQTSGGSPSDVSDANFTITVAGDATCNGYVDGGDLNILLSNWNASNAAWAMGDLTGNGYVDGGDLNVLLSNWNVNVVVPPTAVDDSYSTNAGHALTIAAPGVLANDIRTAPLTAIKLTDPSHGSVTLNSDGSFVYTPTAGYAGIDSFTYKANNTLGDSNAAMVSITITAPTRVLIDCGSSYLSSSNSPNSDGRYWNNFTVLTGEPSVITSCTTSTGGLSGIKLTRTTNFYYAGAVAYITAPVNGWPVSAAADYLNVNSTTVPGTMEFSLLDTTGRKTYELTVFGSVTTSSTTAFTVIAATTTSQQMNCANNTTQWATFSNLTPDAGGKITLQVNLLTTGGRAPLNIMDLAIYDNGGGATGSAAPAGPALGVADITNTTEVFIAAADTTATADTTTAATSAKAATNASSIAAAVGVVVSSTAAVFTAQVNFQPASVVAPQGYLVDSGLPFGKNSSGYSYGWTKDLSAFAVQRNSSASPDIRYDTSVMLVSGGTWEMAVPNGMYDVKIVASDSGALAAQKFTVEGVPMLQTQAQAQTKTAAIWSEETVTVVVTDGRLTITASPASSICFLQITGR